MRNKFASQITVIFLLAINFGLVLQFRLELKEHQSSQEELSLTNSELSNNLALFQQAMAISMPVQTMDFNQLDIPDQLLTGTFAIRLTDKQCSSCIDYTLSEVRKYLDKLDNVKFVVLYTAQNSNSITLGFRKQMLKGIPFIPFPDHPFVTDLDSLNLPYLIYFDENGVQSSYLPFPASNKNIGVYLSHTLTTINKQYEK